MSLLSTNRNFRRLFAASTLSNLGDGVSALAFPWLATLITRDPSLIALVTFATRLPWLLLALPAGVITDRADRRRLILGADAFRFVLTFGVVALILASPALPLAPGSAVSSQMILGLSVLAFLLGTAEVLRDNAAQTMLPAIVDKSQLERANGQLWSVEQVMGSFVGPPLAGFLIAVAVPIPFAFDALTFALAVWLVWGIAIPRLKAKEVPTSFIADLKEGVVWILSNRLILTLAVVLGGLNALHIATTTVLVLFGQEVLGLSAFGYGILLTAGAAGGVIGGLIAPRVAQILGNLASLAAAMVLFMASYLMLYLTSSPIVAGFSLFVGMLGALLWNVVTVSYRQRVIPDDLLGRVNSIYRFFGWGMMPLGALAGGYLVLVFEPSLGREAALRLPFLCATIGTLILLGTILAVVRFPQKMARQ